MRLLARVIKRLAGAEGITLVITLTVLLSFTVLATSALYYSSSASRSASYGVYRLRASVLADAGINNAIAVLANPVNNALDKYAFCAKTSANQPPPPLPCWNTSTYEKGNVAWTGTLYESPLTGSYWILHATSTERNPTGPSARAITRSVRARVPVYPTVTQPLNNPSWNFVFATKPASPLPTCDMTLFQSVQIASPLYVNGNLCLENSSSITRGPLIVHGRLTLRQQANAVGSASARVSEAHLGNGCEWVWGRRIDTPCKGDVDNVWVQTGKLTSSPPTMAPPVPDYNSWYLNASPGPYFPCLTKSGIVPIFDAPVAPSSASDADQLLYMNNNQPVANLTPASSYTCRTAAGELSWNASTKVLTVSGTIFIDGSAYIQNGAVNEYNGQATLYLTGTFLMKNSKLCGGLNTARTDCDFTKWNPNTELLAIVTRATGGQVASGDGVQLISSTFEGAVQAAGAVETDTTSKIDGPIVGTTIILGQSVNTSFPTIAVVPVGMPSNPTVYAEPGPPQMYTG
jgi:hypothetical protein